MSDLALVWNDEVHAADLSVVANDLAIDEGLSTSIMLSLFCDRAAEAGDVLPEGVTDRRGWWADAVADVEGDRIGSRLWLLERSTNTPDVLARAEEYAREALAWLLEDRVAEKVDVTAEFIAARGLGLTVQIYRPQQDPATFRFGRAWAAQEGT